MVTVAGPLGTFTRFPVTPYVCLHIQAPHADNMKFLDMTKMSTNIILQVTEKENYWQWIRSPG
ncbi:hypothetical protein BCE02nite_47720 [Brevibacillus centrosporus]|nr:hypothetical protein BCE02nite_47720 [Brevibacillus centrosporus]